jgi:hypothetical protein
MLALATVTSPLPASSRAVAMPVATSPTKVVLGHVLVFLGGRWVTTTTGASSGVLVAPAVGVVEQAPPADQGPGAGEDVPQYCGAAFVDLEGPASVTGMFSGRADVPRTRFR